MGKGGGEFTIVNTPTPFGVYRYVKKFEVLMTYRVTKTRFLYLYTGGVCFARFFDWEAFCKRLDGDFFIANRFI